MSQLSVELSVQQLMRRGHGMDKASASFIARCGADTMSVRLGMTLKLHWESADKRWNMKGYATNLLKRNVEDLMGVNLVVKF